MKKLATLLLAAGMVVASTAPASAADVKLDGFYRYTFQSASTGFQGQNVETTQHRMRLGLTIAASENLSGYTQFQIGTNDWGTAPKHGFRDDVQTRQMYIDWKVPAAPVKVRMGRSQFGMPADAFGGNNFLAAGWGPRDGIVLNAKATEWLDVTALWARIADDINGAAEDYDLDQANQADVFGVAANLKFDGFSVAPWVAYAAMDEGLEGATAFANSDTDGENDQYASDTYAFGATATLTAFDPFKLVVSASYATREYNTAEPNVKDRKGWSAEAKATYKLGFGTPMVAAWYTSGDDADDAFRNGWLPGFSSYSNPTNTFFDGGTGLTLGVDRYTTLGTWGVMAGVEGMSFLSNLTHTATVTWIQGTNNTQALLEHGAQTPYAYMGTSDSVVELALTSDYAIYKNLIATLELAYLVNDLDDSAEMVAHRGEYDEDDWRVGLTFTYKF